VPLCACSIANALISLYLPDTNGGDVVENGGRCFGTQFKLSTPQPSRRSATVGRRSLAPSSPASDQRWVAYGPQYERSNHRQSLSMHTSRTSLGNGSGLVSFVIQMLPMCVGICALLSRLVQAAGAFAMRMREDKAKESTAVVLFRRGDMPTDVIEKVGEIRRLLEMPAMPRKFTLRYSQARGADDELTVLEFRHSAPR